MLVLARWSLSRCLAWDSCLAGGFTRVPTTTIKRSLWLRARQYSDVSPMCWLGPFLSNLPVNYVPVLVYVPQWW